MVTKIDSISFANLTYTVQFFCYYTVLVEGAVGASHHGRQNKKL